MSGERAARFILRAECPLVAYEIVLRGAYNPHPAKQKPSARFEASPIVSRKRFPSPVEPHGRGAQL